MTPLGVQVARQRRAGGGGEARSSAWLRAGPAEPDPGRTRALVPRVPAGDRIRSSVEEVFSDSTILTPCPSSISAGRHLRRRTLHHADGTSRATGAPAARPSPGRHLGVSEPACSAAGLRAWRLAAAASAAGPCRRRLCSAAAAGPGLRARRRCRRRRASNS
jgi:hypothetical protein